MLIQIVIEGTLKNKVIEKDVSDNNLVSTISFIKEHGLYEHDRWIPPYRIKEIKFEYPAGKRPSKVFYEPNNIDDRMIPESTQNP